MNRHRCRRKHSGHSRANLFLDSLEGLPGLAIAGFITEVEGVFVVAVEPPAEVEEETPPPTIPDPVVDALPVNITTEPSDDPVPGDGPGPNTSVLSQGQPAPRRSCSG